MSTELTTEIKDEDKTLGQLIQTDWVQERFRTVLKKRGDQFLASLLSVNNGFSLPQGQQVVPTSILSSAMEAATLDLPVNRNLGYAWLIPYRDNKRGGKYFAQFQMGYKGYIQLAQRSGQYARMNARPVNKEAFVGFDSIGEPEIDWTKIDETQPPVGYAFAWKMVNGFTKVAYWSKEKVNAHGKRFSKAFSSGPWKTDFDAMAIKTVIANELRRWGLLSIDMQRALDIDQGVFQPVFTAEGDGGIFEYADNNQSRVSVSTSDAFTGDATPADSLEREGKIAPIEEVIDLAVADLMTKRKLSTLVDCYHASVAKITEHPKHDATHLGKLQALFEERKLQVSGDQSQPAEQSTEQRESSGDLPRGKSYTAGTNRTIETQ